MIIKVKDKNSNEVFEAKRYAENTVVLLETQSINVTPDNWVLVNSTDKSVVAVLTESEFNDRYTKINQLLMD
jgi:hypothetical protein